MKDRRLIEVAFPLRQASLDSVHEKNVRHGHISTLHIWPARRPLAACRAALAATQVSIDGVPGLTVDPSLLERHPALRDVVARIEDERRDFEQAWAAASALPADRPRRSRPGRHRADARALARLPGVQGMQSSFALRTVFKTTALPV